jgi:adenosine kinase
LSYLLKALDLPLLSVQSRYRQVNALKDEEIVDTNGAGDALAGGSVGALAAGKPLDEAVEVGHMSTVYVTQVGLRYKWPKVVL